MKLILIVLLILPSLACNLTTQKSEAPLSPAPSATCTGSTTQDVLYFTGPGLEYEALSGLGSGTSVTITAQAENGWYRVYWRPDQREWWVDGSQIALVAACPTLHVETNVVPPISCTVNNISGDSQPIYADATGDNFIARFPPNESMVAFAKSNNRYEVFIEAFGATGWVSADFLQLFGECDRLPA